MTVTARMILRNEVVYETYHSHLKLDIEKIEKDIDYAVDNLNKAAKDYK